MANVNEPLRIGLIGLGAIGQVLARELQARRGEGLQLVGVLCRGSAACAPFGLAPVASVQALLELKPHLVVEAAGHAAVQSHGAACLRAGCDLLLASVGALADAALHTELEAAAAAGASQVLLPAGALGGLDWLQAAHLAGLHSVRLRSSKPPAAWRGTAAEQALDLAGLAVATTFFKGSAREAARLYPKNANVAATLALATLGFDATQVELVADPASPGNVHELHAQGVAGTLSLKLDNAASAENPKSSAITAYSLLRGILARRARFAAC